jgi:hypothetical protein
MLVPSQIKSEDDICLAEKNKNAIIFGPLISFFLLIIIILIFNIFLIHRDGKGLFRRISI